MRAQLSLELLLYLALAGLSFAFALAGIASIMHAYHIQSLLHFGRTPALLIKSQLFR